MAQVWMPGTTVMFCFSAANDGNVGPPNSFGRVDVVLFSARASQQLCIGPDQSFAKFSEKFGGLVFGETFEEIWAAPEVFLISEIIAFRSHERARVR